MNNQQKLRWGIIGAGNIAAKMTDALAKNQHSELIAVASKSLEKAQGFASEHGIKHAFNYDEIVNCKEIDIIYIATTHNFHFENARLALQHGKHVLVEKAFTVNADQAQQLVDIATDNNLFLMEAMWTRFLPAMKLLKNKIAEGFIGDVKMCNFSFGAFVPPKYEQRLKDPALAGGVTLDMGIYPISVVSYLVSELPIEIKTMATLSDQSVDETAAYMFRFPSGCLANISASYNLKMKHQATIYGTKGYIDFPNFQFGEQFSVIQHQGTNDETDIIEISQQHDENGFIYQVEEVVNCIAQGKLQSNVMSLHDTVGIMQVMDKMRGDWGVVYPGE